MNDTSKIGSSAFRTSRKYSPSKNDPYFLYCRLVLLDIRGKNWLEIFPPSPLTLTVFLKIYNHDVGRKLEPKKSLFQLFSQYGAVIEVVREANWRTTPPKMLCYLPTCCLSIVLPIWILNFPPLPVEPIDSFPTLPSECNALVLNILFRIFTRLFTDHLPAWRSHRNGLFCSEGLWHLWLSRPLNTGPVAKQQPWQINPASDPKIANTLTSSLTQQFQIFHLFILLKEHRKKLDLNPELVSNFFHTFFPFIFPLHQINMNTFLYLK